MEKKTVVSLSLSHNILSSITLKIFLHGGISLILYFSLCFSIYLFLFVFNFQSVWGSFWENFKWGYACCHSSVKQSYCTGEAGKVARKVYIYNITYVFTIFYIISLICFHYFGTELISKIWPLRMYGFKNQ